MALYRNELPPREAPANVRKLASLARLAGFRVRYEHTAGGAHLVLAMRRTRTHGLEGFGVYWERSRSPIANWRYRGWPKMATGYAAIIGALTEELAPADVDDALTSA